MNKLDNKVGIGLSIFFLVFVFTAAIGAGWYSTKDCFHENAGPHVIESSVATE